MGSTDSLHLIAELAVAFAGFASLVAVIGRRQGRDYPHWDAARLGSMLETSLLVIAFSLLPLLPFKAGPSAQSSWRISAGVFAVFGVALASLLLTVTQVVMVESFLSFLGLGVQEPLTSLGILVKEGADDMDLQPHALLIPGGVLVSIIVCLTIAGERLRDRLSQ